MWLAKNPYTILGIQDPENGFCCSLAVKITISLVYVLSSQKGGKIFYQNGCQNRY